MTIAAVVLSLWLAAVFGLVGVLKIVRSTSMVANAEHLGYSVAAYQRIGALEVAAAAGLLVGLFWAPLGVAAAVGLVALLVGAVWSLRRAGDGLQEMMPALWLAPMAAATAVLLAI